MRPLPDEAGKNNTNTHKILMVFVELIGMKVSFLSFFLRVYELYIQNGDAWARRAVRLFTHISANQTDLQFNHDSGPV